ncbi:MAG TPA: DapH/DapD/GlmU-related protein [Candidatus Nitrosotalea sp.]|nr:DapH/DapD/GlmU-related protein [Candidatus Nitrosotalea sp.]
MSSKPNLIGTGQWIDSRVYFGENVTVGHCSCIGYPEEGEIECKILDGVNIGAFCVISMGAVLEKKVELEHYCRVDGKTTIGENTKLLYGARVHYNVTIGRDCIINGNCVDRTKIGNGVRHFGRLMHMQSDTKSDWETTDEPSPEIDDDVLIGGNALVIGGIKIGKRVRIGANAVVYGNGLEIGEGARIGPGVVIGGVKISKGVRIGANAVVRGKGLEIGEGAMIEAGEIVNQNVPPNTKFFDGRIQPNYAKK